MDFVIVASHKTVHGRSAFHASEWEITTKLGSLIQLLEQNFRAAFETRTFLRCRSSSRCASLF